MGLDITAYKRLTPAATETDEDGWPLDWRRYHRITEDELKWTNESFPGRANGMKPGIYSFEDRIDFRAGSYSGYSAWRDWLATVGGWSSAEQCWADCAYGLSGPFAELINFSDCDGIIGPEVAAKLAKDFAEHENEVINDKTLNSDFSALYQAWKLACELAADNGIIDFH